MSSLTPPFGQLVPGCSYLPVNEPVAFTGVFAIGTSVSNSRDTFPTVTLPGSEHALLSLLSVNVHGPGRLGVGGVPENTADGVACWMSADVTQPVAFRQTVLDESSSLSSLTPKNAYPVGFSLGPTTPASVARNLNGPL